MTKSANEKGIDFLAMVFIASVVLLEIWVAWGWSSAHSAASIYRLIAVPPSAFLALSIFGLSWRRIVRFVKSHNRDKDDGKDQESDGTTGSQ